MGWFRVDDSFYSNPKVITSSPAAIGLWVMAGTWSAAHLTDGIIPKSMIKRLGGKPSLAEELVNNNLWEKIENDYIFHNWEKYNPTRMDVETERQKAQKRQEKWRENRQKTEQKTEQKLDENLTKS